VRPQKKGKRRGDRSRHHLFLKSRRGKGKKGGQNPGQKPEKPIWKEKEKRCQAFAFSIRFFLEKEGGGGERTDRLRSKLAGWKEKKKERKAVFGGKSLQLCATLAGRKEKKEKRSSNPKLRELKKVGEVLLKGEKKEERGYFAHLWTLHNHSRRSFGGEGKEKWEGKREAKKSDQ